MCVHINICCKWSTQSRIKQVHTVCMWLYSKDNGMCDSFHFEKYMHNYHRMGAWRQLILDWVATSFEKLPIGWLHI